MAAGNRKESTGSTSFSPRMRQAIIVIVAIVGIAAVVLAVNNPMRVVQEVSIASNVDPAVYLNQDGYAKPKAVADLAEKDLLGFLLGNGYEASESSDKNYRDYTKESQIISVGEEEALGCRVITVGDSGTETLYDYLNDLGPEFTKLARYIKGGREFDVGLCTVDGVDGVAVAGSGTVFMVQQGHMSLLKRVAPDLNVTDETSPEDAANAFVDSILAQGYLHSKGDVFGTTQASESSQSAAA